MAQTSSTIKLIFDGTARGLVAAAGQAKAAISSLDDDNSKLNKSADKAGKGLLVVGKAMAGLGAANGAIQVVGGVAGALTQLAPAALLLPGALLGGAAAMGTFKLATAGMGDALKAGLSGDMEKFGEATKDMAPAMQEAARSVVGFKPQIDTLKKTVQGNFWGQFSGDIKGLGDRWLPALTKGLGGISTQLGTVAKGAIAAFNKNVAVADMNQVLDGTAGFLREVGTGVGDVASGFLALAGIGAQRLPRLGEAVGSVAKRFHDWVNDASASGRIDELIDGAIAGFKDLAGIVKNVGSILGSVFTGLGGQVASPLARIRELTGQVAEFLKTAAAQDGLRALGETLRVVGEVVGRVVMTALKELMPTLVKLAPVAQEVARTLGDLLVDALETLGPIIRGVADVFNAFPGSAGAATVAVVGFVAAIKTIKAVNAVTDLLGIESVFSRIAKAAGGKAAGGAAAEAAGKVSGAGWGKGFVSGLKPFVKGAGLAGIGIEITKWTDDLLPKDMGNRWGNIGRDAIAGLAGVFRGAEALISPETMQNWFITPLGDGLNRASELIRGWQNGTGPTFMEWAAGVGGSIRDGMSTGLDEVVAYVGGLPGRIAGALGGLTAPLGQKATEAWQAFVDGTRMKLDEALGFVRSIPGQIGGALSSLAGQLGGVASSAGSAFSASIRGGFDAAVGFIRGIAGQAVGALSSLPGSLGGVASSAANSFSASIRGGLNAAVGFVRGIPGQIAGALGGLGGLLAGAGRALIDGLTAGMRSALGSALAFARSIAGQIAAVKGPLPKDRKTLVPAGAALMQGLGEGMKVGLDDVLVRTSSVAGSVGAAMTGGGGGNPFSGSSGGAVSPMRASAQAAMRTVPAASSSSGGGGRFELVAGPGADSAAAAFIAGLVRTGKLQLQPKAA